MRIPADAIIADEKLTHYLLIHRQTDDKSGFLRRGGFALNNWTVLRDAIRRMADSAEAIDDGGNVYGTFYRVEGILIGPSASLATTLIWMHRADDGRFHFVTLKPRTEQKT